MSDRAIGACPTCGDVMYDDGGPVRFEFRTILGRAYYIDYCSHACARAGR
jgi:hypothetical protein